jgi:DNA-binding NarL/FixJ family response regulator
MTQTKRISVGIIERNRFFRESLTTIIRAQKDMVVVFSTSRQEDRLDPADVILLEWEISGNFQLYQQGNSGTKPRIVAFNADLNHQDFIRCLRSGVRGFILSNSTEQEIIGAIRGIMETGWTVPPPVALKIFSEIANRAVEHSKSELRDIRITSREYEITQLISECLTNKEIAERLNISLGTVKTHVHQILKKFGLQKRAYLINYLRQEPAEPLNQKLPYQRYRPMDIDQ